MDFLFTITAHDYNAFKIQNGFDNGTIVHDTFNASIFSGDSTDCTFYEYYLDYSTNDKDLSDTATERKRLSCVCSELS